MATRAMKRPTKPQPSVLSPRAREILARVRAHRARQEEPEPEETFDPVARAAEKQASRDDDARALASGEKSRAQLKAENGAFAFPRERIRLTKYTAR
jgi:hypothetical protein